MIAAHAMHSSAGRSGCGANINVASRGGVVSPGWAKNKMANVHETARDVAADEISVHAFQICGRKNMPCQNAVAKARSEALNLMLESFKHVYLRSIRNVTISPRRVFACGGSRAIEQTRLSQQNERAFGMLPPAHRVFRLGNLIEAAAQMHRRGAQAFRSSPRNWSMQRVIHFEHSGSVAISSELAFVVIGKFLAADLEQLLRRQVAEEQAVG